MVFPNLRSVSPAQMCLAIFLMCLAIADASIALSSDSAVSETMRRGRAAFDLCTDCHTIDKGGEHKFGPNLHGIFGREVASLKDYSYSHGLRSKSGVWDENALNRYIARPKLAVPGNHMPFPGLTSPHMRRDLIKWLKTNPGSTETVPTTFEALLERNATDRGAQVARPCIVCHTISEGIGNKIGPNLWGVVGRPIASADGFDYSERLMRREGLWTPENLNNFFMATKEFDQGSHRAFRQLVRPEDRAALISWLATLSDDPETFAR